ncbi:MAG: TonB-dependent receptor [Bacteroidales bacterium]|nr:TonB-dependent receptor [Bacteroidales bacterium]
MENVPIINNLKIRGSWGIIGNEKIDYYNRYARVESGVVIFGSTPTVYPSASYAKNGNPDLVWESSTQTDVGLEIGIFENKITGEFDFYNKVTDDILVELSTPGYLGNGQGEKITFNAGKVLNRGFEANLNWRGKLNKLNYRIGLIGSTIHNEVLEIGGSSGIDSVLIGGNLGNGIPVTQSRVGLPIGAFYGYKTDGIFQNTTELNAYPHDAQAGVGDLRFVDVSGDNMINGNDRTYIGSPIPKFIFGFNSEFEFRGFDLSFDLQGQTGNKIFNGKEVVRPDPYNFEKHVINFWRGEGTTNTEPRPSFGGYNYTPSDRFIQDGSFIRLRTLMLGYSLPASVSNKLQMQHLRIYLKGSNLITLTKYTGYTPEIGTPETDSENVLSNGIDNGIYPVTAVYSVGLNLTF